MYDELVKRLRDKAGGLDYDGWVDTAASLEEAADAIEELSLVAESNERSAARWAETAGKAVEQIPRWIPVMEQLPEDGSDILAVQSCCGEARIIPANYDRGVWYDCIFNRVAEHITHWMPLPEPPKEE